MNSNPLAPWGGEGHRLVALLLVAAAGVMAAQSQAWASALGTAAAVYAVLSTETDSRS